MALSDFMPYGAPELLDGAGSRMARATMLGSLCVATLVLALGAVLTRGFTTVPTALDPIREIKWMPEVVIDDPLVHAVPRALTEQVLIDPHAAVRAVEEVLEPAAPVTEFPPAPPGQSGTDRETVEVPPASGSGLLTLQRDPLPGDYVYTDEYPAMVRCSDPVYSDLAREAGVEGTVRVLILVELDGRVRHAIVAPGGSVPMLDEAALTAARSCVFTPALANHHPVKVWVSRSYRFSLH